MKSLKISRTVALAVVVVLAFTLCAQAQDRVRRVSPAFPIGAGEKMLVISGASAQGLSGFSSGTRSGSTTGDTTFAYEIRLPVGTTLKRILGDFVDQDATAGKDITISLVRFSNADLATMITLRTFDTSGISSSNATDFKQIVGNPLSHTMLQGWTYVVLIDFPGGTVYDDLRTGVLKVIYAP